MDSSGNSGVLNRKLGMLFFLAAEAMFFTGLSGAYVVLKHTAAAAWRPASEFLNWDLRLAGAGALAASAIAVAAASNQFRKEKVESGRVLLWTAAVSAVFFILIQVVEGHQLLFVENIRPSSGVSQAAFLITAAFFVLHILVGTAGLIFQASKQEPRQMESLEIFALYWYFVTAAGLMMAGFFYL